MNQRREQGSLIGRSRWRGLILAGLGVALLIVLQAVVPDVPVYLVGVIPLLVGGVFLAYAFVFAPRVRYGEFEPRSFPREVPCIVI